jgi:hypothetical protein
MLRNQILSHGVITSVTSSGVSPCATLALNLA